jgi:hypothetical protein
MGGVESTFKNVGDTISNGVSNVANTVSGGVTSAAGTVAGGVTSAAGTVAGGVTSAANTITNANPAALSSGALEIAGLLFPGAAMINMGANMFSFALCPGHPPQKNPQIEEGLPLIPASSDNYILDYPDSAKKLQQELEYNNLEWNLDTKRVIEGISINVGEDGLPNRDIYNYPFWVIKLTDFKRDYPTKCVKLASGPGGNCDLTDNSCVRVNIYRILPVDGYVSIGDVWAPIRDTNSNTDENLTTIVLIKRFSSNIDKPYARKCISAKYLNNLNKFSGYCRGLINCASRYYCSELGGGLEFPSCGFNVEGDNKDLEWRAGAGISVWKPYDLPGGKYISIGNVVQGLVGGSALEVYAIREDLVQNLKGNKSFYNDVDRVNGLWDSPQGRKLAKGEGSRKRCNYEVWSTSMIFDRKNKDLTQAGTKKFLSTFDGYFGIGDGDFTEGGEQPNTWNTDSLPKSQQYYYYVNFYILKPLNLIKYCCNQDLSTEQECNWGAFTLSKESPSCLDFYRQTCVASNELELVKDKLDGGFCINNNCKNLGDNSNKGKLNCDNEFKKLCEKYTIVNGKKQYYNFEKYPDICSCFMPSDFLKSSCDTIVNDLNIINNKPAKKMLNIDTSDDLQCNQSCTVIPDCRDGKVSTYRKKSNTPNKSYKIQKGGTTNLGTCGDLNLCIQNVTLNIDGSLGDLEINQNAKCKNFKKSKCINSVLSECNILKNGKFYKTIIQEKDEGGCGTVGQEFECSIFSQNPIYDNCDNGVRNIIYKQNKIDATLDDINNSLKILVPVEIQNLGYNIYYSEKTRLGIISSICKDCILDYEPKKINGIETDCVLRDNKWKQIMTYTKIKVPKQNNGNDCEYNKPEKELDCIKDKDCEISVKQEDSSCINGKKSIIYNIDKINSGNGKDCRSVINEQLPLSFKNNYPSIILSNDLKSSRVEISCNNCEVGYKIDLNTNNGNCYLDENDKEYKIKKIPYFIKRESGGGVCSQDKIDFVSSNNEIFEPCNIDQDCTFNEKSLSDNCDEITGERIIKFSVDKPKNGKGMSCIDVGKLIGDKYKSTLKDISYDETDKILTIKTTCEISQDCNINLNPITSICTTNNTNVDIYKINSEEIQNGKTCLSIINNYYNDKKVNNIKVTQNQDKIYVQYPCKKKIVNLNIVYIIFFILMILYIIFLLFKK